jgi:hypothetical protein
MFAPLHSDTTVVQPDVVLERMMPSDTIANEAKIGFYWETYGFALTDTVEVALRIQRKSSQGFARRVGVALSVAQDINSPVAFSWSEPSAAQQRFHENKGISVIGRSVIIDVAQLPAGTYQFEAAIIQHGLVRVSAAKQFSISK